MRLMFTEIYARSEQCRFACQGNLGSTQYKTRYYSMNSNPHTAQCGVYTIQKQGIALNKRSL